MVSIWWVLAAFVIGGYAGAVVVALMSMAHDQEPREAGEFAQGAASSKRTSAARPSHRQTPAEAHR